MACFEDFLAHIIIYYSIIFPIGGLSWLVAVYDPVLGLPPLFLNMYITSQKF